MKHSLAAVPVALMVFTTSAPLAAADSQDDQYISMVQQLGGATLPRNVLIALGHSTCTDLQAASPYVSPNDAINGDIRSGLDPNTARATVTAAISVYCPAGNASASGCNSADCVPNVTHNAVQGGPCTIGTHNIFGLDASGNTLICTSYSEAGGTVIKGHWSSAPPLVGVRNPGAPCSGGGGAAQSPDGSPMMCQNGVWAVHLG